MTAQRTLDPKKLVRAIHAEARKRGLDDTAYRAALEGATGKRSSSECTPAELQRALRALRGEPLTPHRGRAPAQGAIPGKVRALAMSLWNLGAWPGYPEDSSIAVFVERQAKVSDIRFLTPEHSSAVIEAMRAMCARQGFLVPHNVPADLAQRALVLAQVERLAGLDAEAADAFGWVRTSLESRSKGEVLDAVAALGRLIRARQPEGSNAGGPHA